ncbi:hypothetical protein C4G74_RS22970 [Vibrio parahaemolyticus]|nr:hypothetical protein [Vibrio parahaemolyticus]EHZ2493365.1 hypothetical protein [Vibrio parahaemolyticus]EJB1765607.1 hypothetical protein [Vibrio parahaemolyticus]EJG0670515.1 hypothetical protein [Vibrio parahaemolyticus]EJG1019215.1 hypothetical protein [Vibrio parahaemolyticus]
MKEVITAIDTRIKAPYFGYSVLAFIALNWRGIFTLFMMNGEPSARLEAFDSMTSVWSLVLWPLIIGCIVTATSNWIKYVFSLVEKKPLELIDYVNIDAEHKRLLRIFQLEALRSELLATKEKELIDRALRDDQVSKIEDEETKEKLTKDLASLRELRDGIELSEPEKQLLNEFEHRKDHWSFGQLESRLSELVEGATYQDVKGTIINAAKLGKWPNTVKRYLCTNYAAFGNVSGELNSTFSPIYNSMSESEKAAWGFKS